MRITKKNLLSVILLSFFSLALVVMSHPALVSAQTQPSLVSQQEGLTEVGRVYGDEGSGPVDVRAVVAKLINIVLGFLGVIFLGLAVFAGFQYMTSAGNQEQTKQSITTLKNAVIGIIIVLISWGITRMVLSVTGRAVNGSADYTSYHTYP